MKTIGLDSSDANVKALKPAITKDSKKTPKTLVLTIAIESVIIQSVYQVLFKLVLLTLGNHKTFQRTADHL